MIDKLTSPTPEDIKAAREVAGLTIAQAATTVHAASYTVWQMWEKGRRKMHPAFWELFLIKTGQRNIL